MFFLFCFFFKSEAGARKYERKNLPAPQPSAALVFCHTKWLIGMLFVQLEVATARFTSQRAIVHTVKPGKNRVLKIRQNCF